MMLYVLGLNYFCLLSEKLRANKQSWFLIFLKALILFDHSKCLRYIKLGVASLAICSQSIEEKVNECTAALVCYMTNPPALVHAEALFAITIEHKSQKKGK